MFSLEGVTYAITLLVIIGVPVWFAYRAVNKANALGKVVQGGGILWKAMRKE